MGACGSSNVVENVVLESPPREMESSDDGTLPWVCKKHNPSSCSVLINNQQTIYEILQAKTKTTFVEDQDKGPIISNQRVMYERLMGRKWDIFSLPFRANASHPIIMNRILSNQNVIFEILLTSTSTPLPHVLSESEKEIARLPSHESSLAFRVLWNQLAIYNLVKRRKSCHNDQKIDTPLSRKMREELYQLEQDRKKEDTKRKLFQQQIRPSSHLRDVTNNIG